MLKRFLAEKGFIFLIGILLCAAAISFMYFRMENAEKALAEYWLAKSCPTPHNCRQKVKATVLEGHGVSIFVKGFQTKYSSLPSSRSTKYKITVLSTEGENEIIISANSPSGAAPFDISQVHVPNGRDSHFIEQNFYKGKPVYIETWRGQVTFLFLDTLIDISDPIIEVKPSQNVPTTLSSIPAPNTYEIGLPTSVNPVFREAAADTDFRNTIFICIALAIFLVSLIEQDLRMMLKNAFRNTKASLYKIMGWNKARNKESEN